MFGVHEGSRELLRAVMHAHMNAASCTTIFSLLLSTARGTHALPELMDACPLSACQCFSTQSTTVPSTRIASQHCPHTQLTQRAASAPTRLAQQCQAAAQGRRIATTQLLQDALAVRLDKPDPPSYICHVCSSMLHKRHHSSQPLLLGRVCASRINGPHSLLTAPQPKHRRVHAAHVQVTSQLHTSMDEAPQAHLHSAPIAAMRLRWRSVAAAAAAACKRRWQIAARTSPSNQGHIHVKKLWSSR